MKFLCWSHVHSNILPQLKRVSAQSKSVHDKLLSDLVNIQWSGLNEASFKKSVDLVEKKYLDQRDAVMKRKTNFDGKQPLMKDDR